MNEGTTADGWNICSGHKRNGRQRKKGSWRQSGVDNGPWLHDNEDLKGNEYPAMATAAANSVPSTGYQREQRRRKAEINATKGLPPEVFRTEKSHPTWGNVVNGKVSGDLANGREEVGRNGVERAVWSIRETPKVGGSDCVQRPLWKAGENNRPGLGVMHRVVNGVNYYYPRRGVAGATDQKESHFGDNCVGLSGCDSSEADRSKGKIGVMPPAPWSWSTLPRLWQQSPPQITGTRAPEQLLKETAAGEWPRQPFDYYLVVDFEATCDDVSTLIPQEIIEFPSVLLNSRTLEIEACFRVYVRPTVHPTLTEFCTKLTGIQQATVDAGLSLGEALVAHDQWLQDRGLLAPKKQFLIVTWTDWDCQTMLELECRLKKLRKPGYFSNWANLKLPYRQIYGRPTQGLRAAVETAGLVWEGSAHSGLDDAKNTARLTAALMRKGIVLSATNGLTYYQYIKALQLVETNNQRKSSQMRRQKDDARREEQSELKNGSSKSTRTGGDGRCKDEMPTSGSAGSPVDPMKAVAPPAVVRDDVEGVAYRGRMLSLSSAVANVVKGNAEAEGEASRVESEAVAVRLSTRRWSWLSIFFLLSCLMFAWVICCWFIRGFGSY
ncbi:hypothetical protein CBR_g41532 [Chara braunii]|uniref:Exonuclease domain-containing protein n=1 Tax=Chara braunii TaxID=69332 RepID=A0A388K2P7_CHABU|nr:hypothetical protein CBR_g41532 [Chara braunii]|eukprot:GBG64331.1 hypothetical protein CBR_g41532 [Chara braunii]